MSQTHVTMDTVMLLETATPARAFLVTPDQHVQVIINLRCLRSKKQKPINAEWCPLILYVNVKKINECPRNKWILVVIWLQRNVWRYQRLYSESVNRRRRDNTMAKDKWQTDKQRFTEHYTENRATQLRCPGMASSSNCGNKGSVNDVFSLNIHV